MAGEYVEFNNGTQPALNDTNINLMQQRIRQHIDGYILYESENGTTGNVTLSDSAVNYDYISIEGRRTGHAYPSQKFYKPNGKTITLSSTYALNDDIYLYTKVISISGTQITVLSSKLGYFNSSSMAVASDSDNYITRVVGYKE